MVICMAEKPDRPVLQETAPLLLAAKRAYVWSVLGLLALDRKVRMAMVLLDRTVRLRLERTVLELRELLVPMVSVLLARMVMVRVLPEVQVTALRVRMPVCVA